MCDHCQVREWFPQCISVLDILDGEHVDVDALIASGRSVPGNSVEFCGYVDWAVSFGDGEWPDWTCPSCGRDHLRGRSPRRTGVGRLTMAQRTKPYISCGWTSTVRR